MTSAEINKAIIEKFYTAFAAKDAHTMVDCYHAEIEFEDPAFGSLKGNEAKAMWQMLVERGKDLNVEFSNITAGESLGTAHWDARYSFSATGRKVVNHIDARFEFKDGKIYKHTDTFNLNRWFVMAFGWKGYLFIVLPFLRNAFRRKAKQSLSHFMAKKKS